VLQVTALIRFGTGHLTLYQAIQVYNLSWISVSSIMIGLGVYARTAGRKEFKKGFDFKLAVIATAEIYFFFVTSLLLWAALPLFKSYDPCVNSTPFFIFGKSVSAATTGRRFNLALVTLSTILQITMNGDEIRRFWSGRKVSRTVDGLTETVRFFLAISRLHTFLTKTVAFFDSDALANPEATRCSFGTPCGNRRWELTSSPFQ
jgi:hypothetical protein